MNRMPKRNNDGDEGESLVVPSSSTESDSLHNDDYVSDSDSDNSRNGGGSNGNLPKVYRRRGKGEDGNKEGQAIDDTCEDESLITYIRKKKVTNPSLSNGHADKKMKSGNKAKSNGESNQVQGEGKVAKKAKKKEDNGKQKSTHGGKSASKAKSNGDEKRMNKRVHKDDEEKVAKSNGQNKKIKRDKDNHKTNSDNQSEEKRSKAKKKREDVEEEEEEDGGALYQFPHNRIHRIIKDENVDSRMTQEAIFVINKATEKFLEVFCREAYACAFLDRNNYVGYDHLSSVVSKRQRFDFLSDFVPPKVRAEDALAEISKAEET